MLFRKTSSEKEFFIRTFSKLTRVKAFESRPKFVTETSVLSVFEDFFV